ncbi:transcription antitermination factor NusB [soil metagenome]
MSRAEYTEKHTVDPARDAVCRFMMHQVAKWPGVSLTDLRLPPGIQGRDAALAHAIYAAVMGRWITLEHVIRKHCDTPWEQLETQVRAALLVGASQLLLLDRIPAYAALDHAVQWTKNFTQGGAGRLVNAVLRRISELALGATRLDEYSGAPDELPLTGGGALRLAMPVFFPGDDADSARERLRLATGHGKGMWAAWHALDMAALKQRALHSLVTSPIVMNTTSAPAKLIEDRGLFQPHSMPGHHVYVGPAAEIAPLIAAAHGALWVQDAASSQAVRLLAQHHYNEDSKGHADGAGTLIVDLCAGQGTKTRQLAALLPRAEIYATDIDERRLGRLAETFARPDYEDRVKVMPIDILKKRVGLRGGCDTVLLDVPCSNTGVIARRPEAKFRFTPASVAEVQGLQRDIIRDGLRLLAEKPGAALVYSTCSLEHAENADQVAGAEKALKLVKVWEHALEPSGLPGGPASGYHDGSYAAGLVRE